MSAWTRTQTPMGELLLVADDAGLQAVAFAPAPDPADGGRDDDHPVLVSAAVQLAEYFAGAREEFDLPLAARGTAFQQRVWAALTQIPYGTTTTYRALAASLGLTGHGSRAVGRANGTNPVAIVVPCHRVVGSDGSLTGYAGGLDRKRALLVHEGTALF